MDALGIDVQVLHNTIFIESVSDRPEVEVPCAGRGTGGWPTSGGWARAGWAGCVPTFPTHPERI